VLTRMLELVRRPRIWMRIGAAWLLRVRYCLAAAFLAPWVMLFVGATFVEVPESLLAGPRSAGGGGGGVLRPAPPSYDASVRILDRHELGLKEVRASDGQRATWVSLGDVPPVVRHAVLAAEDKRFEHHFGVDPIATARAAAQNLWHRRVVSGASTITQQLARQAAASPRTLSGKLGVMMLAVRIEQSLSKEQILERYLNDISFGQGTRGIEAASRRFFDKPVHELSLAEAATLASIPRGPAVYDPHRGHERLRRRRDRVLQRMAAAGWTDSEKAARAAGEPISVQVTPGGLSAPHFVHALLRGDLDASVRGRGQGEEIVTTLDRELQREVQALTRGTVRGLRKSDVSASSVVVLDNASGDILAYVGSHDIADDAGLGHNDGVLARRQPGSTLKPFVYGLAMERLGFSTATVVPDVDLHFPSGAGDYHPRNFDGRHHGPVRLREALANSYNIPAVWTAQAVSPHRVVHRLRELGLSTVDRGAEHYGLAIALGDVEVRLLDLANAYATLARGGLFLPVRAVVAVRGPDGSERPLSPPPRPKQVLDERAAYAITHVLADASARLDAFGRGSVLELPFEVAVKTGTSKAFRDNLTVGFTPRVTVAVWAGNFDGSPMHGVSGVSGAGPLFRSVMLATAQRYPAEGFHVLADVERAEVCPLSGLRRTEACPHGVHELFLDRRPDEPCDMHVAVDVDRRNGLLAGPGCTGFVDSRSFESFPPLFANWARVARRPLAPTEDSPSCPGASELRRDRGRGRSGLSVLFPVAGSRFFVDPGASAPSAITLSARAPTGVRGLSFELDGSRLPAPSGQLSWPLRPGSHTLRVFAESMPPSDLIEFTVD